MEEQATEQTVNAVAATATTVPVEISALQEITISSVYLMGFSFIAGSAFTVLMLLVLDYVRHLKQKKQSS